MGRALLFRGRRRRPASCSRTETCASRRTSPGRTTRWSTKRCSWPSRTPGRTGRPCTRTASSSTGQVLHLKAKVCLLGGLGVGKTSLVRRYVLDEFDDHYVITLGAKVTKREVDVGIEGVGPVRVDLTLWDTMGEESLRPTLTDIVLHGIKGVLGVCDVSDRRSIGPMASWIDLTSGLRPGIPVQILANKSDLPRKEQAMRDVLSLGRRHAAPCYLTSAKTGDNVTAAFEDLALRITTQALSESESRLDPASLGIVVETSVKPRSFL